MIEVGAAHIGAESGEEAFRKDTFFSTLRPMTDNYEPAALSSIGRTREETLLYEDPEKVIKNFKDWVEGTTKDRPILFSDNNGFDWQFVNYYFVYFLGVGKNPFGHSSRRIGDLYSGIKRNLRASNEWKKLRRVKHDHTALNDAMGTASALIEIGKMYNLRLTNENRSDNRNHTDHTKKAGHTRD